MSEQNGEQEEGGRAKTYTWKVPVEITVIAGNNTDSRESMSEIKEKIEEGVRRIAAEDHAEIVQFSVGMGERGKPMEICRRGAEKMAAQTEMFADA